MNQGNLHPDEQKLLFQLLKKQGSQPTSGGMDQSVPDPGAQDPALFGPSAPAPQAQPAPMEMPAPGSFANDPEGAKAFIGQYMNQAQKGMPLQRNEQGQLYAELPSSNSILKMFGKKDKVMMSSVNYYDSLSKVFGKDVVDSLVPGETPMTPEGKPFISAKTYEKLQDMLHKTKVSENDKPNALLGKAMLAKVEKIHGKDSPIYTNLKEHLDSSGGVAASKLGEFNTAFGVPTKEEDIIKDNTTGLFMLRNRATGKFEAIPGQTTGINAALSIPVNRDLFNDAKKRFDADIVVKEYKKTIDALGNTSALLESNNPAAIGSLFSNMARSVGKEVGALTNEDIARSVGDSGMAATLYRWYNKRIDFFRGKGQLGDKDVADFRGLYKDISSAADARYQKAVESHIRSTKAMVPDLSEDFIRQAYDVAVPFQEAPQRRLEGQATNYPNESKGIKTASDYMSKFKAK
jgi:hypothetical protein